MEGFRQLNNSSSIVAVVEGCFVVNDCDALLHFHPLSLYSQSIIMYLSCLLSILKSFFDWYTRRLFIVDSFSREVKNWCQQ